MDAESFKSKIDLALSQQENLTGIISTQYCVIKIPIKERHFWSPQLTLTIERNEGEKNCTIRGLYGPKPSVWAIFFMSYAALGLMSLFIGIYGLSLYLLEKPAPIMWLIPVFFVVALVLYFIAQTGQKLGAQQMYQIHHFYETITKHQVNIE